MSRMIYVSSDISDGRGQYEQFKVKPSNINEDGSLIAESPANDDKPIDIE